MLVAKRFGGYLTEQVNFDARIDGDELIVLRDDAWIVHIFNREELHGGIVVRPIVELLRAFEHRCNIDAFMKGLLGSVDDSALCKLHHLRGEKLAVHTKILLV